MKPKYFTLFMLLLFVCSIAAQTGDSKKKIFMDVSHGQKFWNDPVDMTGPKAKKVKRVEYMNEQFRETASSVNAEYDFLKGEITPETLTGCDLLFIHIPSSLYAPAEVKAITDYLNAGGSMFLAVDEDYWATLEQSNINDFIKPFGIELGETRPDSVSGGYTKEGVITASSYKIPYAGGRYIKGGTPFCFDVASEENPFGVYKELENGGKLIIMSDGMVSLFMNSWGDVNDYQCTQFMHDVFKWLLE